MLSPIAMIQPQKAPLRYKTLTARRSPEHAEVVSVMFGQKNKTSVPLKTRAKRWGLFLLGLLLLNTGIYFWPVRLQRVIDEGVQAGASGSPGQTEGAFNIKNWKLSGVIPNSITAEEARYRHTKMAGAIPKGWDWSQGWGGHGKGVTAIACVPGEDLARSGRVIGLPSLVLTDGMQFDLAVIDRIQQGDTYIEAVKHVVKHGYDATQGAWPTVRRAVGLGNVPDLSSEGFVKPVQAGDPLPTNQDVVDSGLARFYVAGTSDIKPTAEAFDRASDYITPHLGSAHTLNRTVDASGANVSWNAIMTEFEGFVEEAVDKGITIIVFDFNAHGSKGPGLSDEEGDDMYAAAIGGSYSQGGRHVSEDYIRNSLQALVAKVEREKGQKIHLVYINKSCQGGESITDDDDVSKGVRRELKKEK